MKRNPLLICSLIFILLVVAELFVLSTFKNLFAPRPNSIVIAIITTLVGFAFIAVSYFYKPPKIASKIKTAWKVYAFLSLVILVMSVVIMKKTETTLRRMPIELFTSDIVPTTMVFAKHWTEGKNVYLSEIDHKHYVLKPGRYMPFRWMPYVISNKYDFDPRFLSSVIMLIGLAIAIFYAAKVEKNIWMILLKTALPFVFYIDYLDHNRWHMAHSNDILMAGWYVAAAVCLCQKKVGWQTFGLILALLSRLSILFFVPVYFIVLFIGTDWKTTLKAGGFFTAYMLIFFIIPFEFYKPDVLFPFLEIFKNRLPGAFLPAWQQILPQRPGVPYHLYDGQGLAWMFFEMTKLELIDRANLLKKVILYSSLFEVIALSGFFFAFKDRLHRPFFLLGAAKIILAMFYTLIYVPYQYLFVIGIFFSLAMVMVLPLREVFGMKEQEIVAS